MVFLTFILKQRKGRKSPGRIYGLLTYENGEVSIPNKELLDKFRELLMNKETMGYVYRLANESKRMLAAILRGDTDHLKTELWDKTK